jgi:hypothetical protein
MHEPGRGKRSAQTPSLLVTNSTPGEEFSEGLADFCRQDHYDASDVDITRPSFWTDSGCGSPAEEIPDTEIRERRRDKREFDPNQHKKKDEDLSKLPENKIIIIGRRWFHSRVT